MDKNQSVLDKIISLAKRRGFVFPAGEIYGGTRSAWDYGPLGTELKNNIKNQWWNSVVQQNPNVTGIDSSIILPTKTWEASGHLKAFTDPLIECLKCHKRQRADSLCEEFIEKKCKNQLPSGITSLEDPKLLEQIPCPNCGNRGSWTEPKNFSGLMKTYLGPVEDESGLHFLRPETAQGIFLNFLNVQKATRLKPPFGIAQIGKSFRNEITPGNFIFRTREFEQMELEFFVEPGTDEKWHQNWIDSRLEWYIDLGIAKENLRIYEHPKEKLSHYSKRTVDIEYKFGFKGSLWGELEGIANRTDFDLKTHSEHSGVSLDYKNPATNEHYTPFVIEPSAGLTRSLMAFLIESYSQDQAPTQDGKMATREYLKLDKRLAPIKVAVLPISKGGELSDFAQKIAKELRKNWVIDYDETQNIGKRYRRQDEIGTPLCVTIDFESLVDNAVTIRNRDTMKQERVSTNSLFNYITNFFKN